MRGAVYIAPVAWVPADGSMVDPATGRFHASWQDDDEPDVIDEVEVDDAEAAIEWGRARSEFVFIRLGNRGDTYFSAGVTPADDDEGPMPLWPPEKPPDGGWWEPPTRPTLEEALAVESDVAGGRRGAQDAAAWAFDRFRPTLEASADLTEDPVVAVLGRLTAGWVQMGTEVSARRVSPGSVTPGETSKNRLQR